MFQIIVYALFSFILIYMIHFIYSHFQKQIHNPLNVNPECVIAEEIENKDQENIDKQSSLENYLNSL